LQHTRREIEIFAAENNLHWVEDSSNASSKYTRNFFRNEIIPAIQTAYPQVEENLLHTIRRLQKTEQLYSQLVHGLLKKLLVVTGAETKIPINKFLAYQHTALPYEVFKLFYFGEKQLPEILKLAESESGSFIQNEQYRIIKHRKWFIISPLQTTEAATFVIDAESRSVAVSGGVLRMRTVGSEQFQLNNSPLVAQFDAREVRFPLLVRRWKAGDYFYPLGMRKKKKLARFFIDLKLPVTGKEKIWVVESGSRIIWVIGHRIDDRVKVTDSTKEILQLRFVPH
jgi:tRNA(Ile)-lysidine synthase